MNSIRVTKSSSFAPNKAKWYNLSIDGREMGTLHQDVTLTRWIVEDDWSVELSRHGTIKAALRAASVVC